MDDAFPIRDYDHLALGDLRHRIRSLSAEDLRRVLEHERAHAHRTAVIEALTARLDEVESGAQPSGGDQRATPPADSGHRAPQVSPAHSPDPTTPLRHGVAGHTPTRGR
ncbi:hypothetical protein [Saccharothrix sp.]|uniref:hypothetical protein n=1 Tax=Saccharothrix sp. TaxID=1873460 RepID=UPI002810B263|nr:hypothetical protein [Saccharothrix sp.]